jgi:hypothetical protein
MNFLWRFALQEGKLDVTRYFDVVEIARVALHASFQPL